MLRFDETLRAFLTRRIVVGNALLPVHYAPIDDLDAFQVGFRTHGHSGESLVSECEGGWHPDWYVIALTGLDDPVFIATSGADQGYPVYSAAHGAGRWEAVPVAPSLEAFGRLLEALAGVDEVSDFNAVISAEVGHTNAFWQEVVEAAESAAQIQEAPAISPYDPAEFAACDLVVVALGPQKLRVVQRLSKRLGVSLKDTLALAEAPPFTATCGVRKQLRAFADQLAALGATIELRTRP